MNNGNLILNVLSLWQPWASLWLADLKHGETRHFRNKFFGLVVVHATLYVDHEFCKARKVQEALNSIGFNSSRELPRGALIGTLDLKPGVRVETVRDYLSEQELCFGNFDDGRFWWPAEDKKQFSSPLQMKGRQSVPWNWTVPEADFRKLFQGS